jgi:hypothetical protein
MEEEEYRAENVIQECRMISASEIRLDQVDRGDEVLGQATSFLGHYA